MRIDYSKEARSFVATSRYQEREILRDAKFHWNPEQKHWESNSIHNVKNLEEFLSPEAKLIYDQLWNEYNGRIAASQALDSTMELPCPEGKNYHPFQKAGIEYLIKHENVLLADEMGLGKTIQVIGYLNYARPKKVLIISPLSVKSNWLSELKTWLVYDTSIEVINGKEPKWNAEITLIHYDALKKHKDRLLSETYDLVVMDEAHYIKNIKTQRTVVCLSLQGRKRVLLTGTPILNRPNELFTLLLYLRNPMIRSPQTGRASYSYFTYRYCVVNEYMGHMQVVGGKNLDELQTKLRGSCMMRRLKKDVLAELPPKTRQMIPIPRGAVSSSVLHDSDDIMEIIKKQAGSWEDVMKMLKTKPEVFEKLAKARHQLGVSKIPMAISFIEDALENEDKVVVFAHHRDVVEAIGEHFKGSVSLYGGMSIKERDYAISEFNTNPDCKVFVGSVSAAGMGINLQKSGCSVAIFVEIDWRPAYNIQAEDRIHRVGQTNNVLIYNLIVDDTLDGYIAEKVLNKQIDINKALDDKVKIQNLLNTDPEFEELKKQIEYDDMMTGLVEKPEPKDIYKIKMRPEDATEVEIKVQPLLSSLKLLTGMDPDFAREQNESGFNKVDGSFGHALAAKTWLTEKQARAAYKMMRKYKRQIPEELYQEIYGVSE